ncbi:MAG: NAD(P)H-dependent oxidoreductase subunit E [Anaerolineae bacterium]
MGSSTFLHSNDGKRKGSLSSGKGKQSDSGLELGMDVTVVEGILERHDRAPSAIIAIMQDVQDEVNYLPEGTLRYVADRLGIPASKIFRLATFYRAFSLEPRGRHVINVCTGTACHVRGAVKIVDALEREIGIQAGETDEQLEFTLETVNCVGACALGPVIMVDNEYHGQMTGARAVRMIKKLRATEQGTQK